MSRCLLICLCFAVAQGSSSAKIILGEQFDSGNLNGWYTDQPLQNLGWAAVTDGYGITDFPWTRTEHIIPVTGNYMLRSGYAGSRLMKDFYCPGGDVEISLFHVSGKVNEYGDASFGCIIGIASLNSTYARTVTHVGGGWNVFWQPSYDTIKNVPAGDYRLTIYSYHDSGWGYTYIDSLYVSVVPEPAGLAVLATGVVSLLGIRRRRR